MPITSFRFAGAMRAVPALLVLALFALPFAGATPVAGTDCAEHDPVAEGCGAYAYVFEDAGTGGCAAMWGHSQGGTTGPSLRCFAGTKGVFVAAGCSESRWSQDPYSEDVMRACFAGAGDATGEGTFASCSAREHRSPSWNATWLECYPVGLTAGCSMKNLTAGDAPKLEVPGLRCGGGQGDASSDADVDAGGRNATYSTYGIMKGMRASVSCAINGSDANAGCGDELRADLDDDGASDAACRSQGNITQKKWLPANFRCGAGADADGDGEPDQAACALDTGTATDPNTSCGDMRVACAGGSGVEGACSARNGTRPAFFDITYRIGNGTISPDPDFDMFASADADSDGASDAGVACGDAIAMGGASSTGCRVATKWKVYSPLPGGFREASAECGIAIDEPGVRCMGGDLDGDGAPDVLLIQRGGGILLVADGCAVTAKPGGMPATRGCLA